MIIDVAVPVRVGSTFHYDFDLEDSSPPSIGSIIQIPFRNRSTFGFVVGFPSETLVAQSKLRKVENVLVKESLFDEKMLTFLKWVSEYYAHPIGEVIATAIPKAYWEKRKQSPKGNRRRKPIWDAIEQTCAPTLTEEQQSALKTILDPGEKRPYLLHGVTGSGKTEVYMQVLERVLAEGKGGIVLVPEIALTPQLTERFRGRFKDLVAVLHSDLTNSERFEQWEKILSGKASIVVGARSAVFAPVKNLGVIIVDEEHETSFKQEDSLRYHARDLAVMRGVYWNAKVILGSATPSLESYANVLGGKYVRVSLTKRVQERPLPTTTFVDLKDPMNLYSYDFPWMTKPLAEKIEKTIQNGQQVLLYLNRLGFAHFLYCSDCGHTWRCQNCDVALTYYQRPPSLKCHYCGMNRPVPHECSECKGNKLQTIGLGTEQVEKKLKELFPTARIGRMDRSQVKTRKELETLLKQVANRELDILIGTQMVTKGHDFPGIALVGILVADASLNLPDFRSNERTFQVVTQVSGRAGRSDVPGEVVIQTVNPQSPVLQSAARNKTEEFYHTELNARRLFGFPPYRRLVMLRFQHRQNPRVARFAEEVTNFLRSEAQKQGMHCSILGPSEAPLSKLKNLYRWQALIKADSVKDAQKLLRGVHDYVAKSKLNVQFAVDVDPLTSL